MNAPVCSPYSFASLIQSRRNPGLEGSGEQQTCMPEAAAEPVIGQSPEPVDDYCASNQCMHEGTPPEEPEPTWVDHVGLRRIVNFLQSWRSAAQQDYPMGN